MADTHFIKIEIEPYVLQRLTEKFGVPFSPAFLPVGILPNGNPRTHQFDAVSEDKSIVAGIKSHTGKTSGGKIPTAKISGVYREIFFLSLVDAPQKLLVLTDPEFYDIIVQEFTGILPDRIEIIHVPLSSELQAKMDSLKGRND